MSFTQKNEGFFRYGDFDSSGLLTIEEYPRFEKPKPRLSFQSVPGRIGDIATIDEGFDNILVVYKIWFEARPGETLAQTHTYINGKLTASLRSGDPSYQLLYDNYCLASYNKSTGIAKPYLRQALFVGPLVIDSTYNQIARATLTFSCRPQLYNDGDFDGIDIGVQNYQTGINWTKLTGNSGYTAMPLIKLKYSGSVMFKYKSGQTSAIHVTLSNSAYTAWIDCENKTIYEMDAKGRKRAFSSGYAQVTNDFPVIPDPAKISKDYLQIYFIRASGDTINTQPADAQIYPRRFVF